MDREGHVAGVATGPAQEGAGGRGGELGGLGPAPHGEPAPAGGEPAARYRYTTEYRRTRMGGFTDSIAICETCRRMVEPVAMRFSRTGRHGEIRYEHQHPLVIVVFEQSNSGNRHYYIKGDQPRDGGIRAVVETAGDAWTFYNEDFGAVEKRVKAMLSRLMVG